MRWWEYIACFAFGYALSALTDWPFLPTLAVAMLAGFMVGAWRRRMS